MWDIKCIIAALCFVTSNTLFIVHGALMIMMKDDSSNTTTVVAGAELTRAYWKELDPSYIETQWTLRERQRPLMMSAALFGAMAWFWMIPPVVQSAWVLSRGGKRLVGLHILLAAMAICGGMMELLAHLLTVGMTNASQWLARDFNLNDWDDSMADDGTGWRVLEMIHIVTMGMVLWVDAFEAMALFGIVVVMFYSVTTEQTFSNVNILVDDAATNNANDISADDDALNTEEFSGSVHDSASSCSQEPSSSRSSTPPPSAFHARLSSQSMTAIQPTFTKCFANFGLFIGFLALLDFFADVLRFINWHIFGKLALATNILIGVVFIPTWLLILARQLPAATERLEREGRGVEKAHHSISNGKEIS